ncbi:AFUA_2G17970 family ergot alkaloid biosynthesis protein [Scedosporium apiospermum]|uniref:AFUA_2G17970 family ergot alkaloid biosynthesis protein n=1 Tax=Pseudallescheria apiosperma TaxID=563466 RepID=A0A084FYG6_PSEDA|nr:AFUA_2G17970 family ergot alkaloid biosynthesis protein [Scedosporium apiospermum]KEZ40128.1 AFUA_2G17970 family ergot alkaloid biosynthesis protein [Scedosporium apiospermum]
MTTNSTYRPFLILGGTGTVGSRVTHHLRKEGHPALIASRSAKGNGEGPLAAKGAVYFDWYDESTYLNAFNHPLAVGCGGIRGIFIVAPPSTNMAPAIQAFIDLAKGKGVRRFVFVSASSVSMGDEVLGGLVHKYLYELGSAGEIEWAVLRPCWFMENFITQRERVDFSPEGGVIYSATGEGRIPFVSADDVAECAACLLLDPDPPNSDFLILGPEALSYGDAAKILSEVLQKPVIHKDLTVFEMEARLRSFGISEDYAKILGAMETNVKHGSEDRMDDSVLAITGKRPKTLREWAEEYKAALLET